MPFLNLFKTKVEASVFSRDLFGVWVINDLESKCGSLAVEWRKSGQFDEQKCKYIFTYLVSVVAVALTETTKRRPEFARIISDFRLHACSRAKDEWDVLQDRFDDDVERAAASLARLIFTNPSENRGLSFEWSREWLASFGVNEHNPLSLFKMALDWKNSFIHLCRLFDKVRLK